MGLGGVDYGFGTPVRLRECHCLVLVGLDVVYCWKKGFFFSEVRVGLGCLGFSPRCFILRLVVEWFYK